MGIEANLVIVAMVFLHGGSDFLKKSFKKLWDGLNPQSLMQSWDMLLEFGVDSWFNTRIKAVRATSALG